MKTVYIKPLTTREVHTFFTKTMQYPVQIVIPEGVEAVEEDGRPYIIVSEPPLPGMAPMRMMLSLQVAAERGLVQVKSFGNVMGAHTSSFRSLRFRGWRRCG